MKTTKMFLVYKDSDGEFHYQPWQEAQAVDLKQFRRPLKVARTSMEWARNDDAVAECDRLLKLIDSETGDDMELIGWSEEQ